MCLLDLMFLMFKPWVLKQVLRDLQTVNILLYLYFLLEGKLRTGLRTKGVVSMFHLYRLFQGCVVFESVETTTLHAPKGSATMKSSEKGIGQQVHKFSFTKVLSRCLRLLLFVAFSVQFYELVRLSCRYLGRSRPRRSSLTEQSDHRFRTFYMAKTHWCSAME